MNRLLTTILITVASGGASIAQDIPFMDGAMSSRRKADLYAEKQQYADAVKYYTQALKKSPDDTMVRLKLARCYTALKDPENVVNYYSGSIDSEQATEADVLNYAEALVSNHEDEAARKWYDEYQETYPDDDRILRRSDGLANRKVLYMDSVSYRVQRAAFNSADADFSPVYREDRTLFVSNRKQRSFLRLTDGRNGQGFLGIYTYSDDQVTPFGAFDRRLHVGPLAFYEGGTKAMVTVNQKESLRNNEASVSSRLKLAIYAYTGGRWIVESDFPFNHAEYSVCHPSFDEVNQVLYFVSDQPGGKGGADLYRSEYRNGTWSEPENLESVNTSGDEVFPFIFSNGDLYFASDGYAGLGGLDIYQARAAHPDNVYNPGYPVNSAADDFGLVLDTTGTRGYLSSNRENGVGDDDIYELTVYTVRVESSLTDQDTGLPVSGEVQIIDQRTGEEVPHEQAGDKIVFEVLKGRPYLIKAETEGYVATEMEFKTMSDKDLVTLDVPITKQLEKVGSEESASPARIVRVANLASPMTYWIMPDQKLKEGKGTTSASADTDLEIKDVFFWFDSDKLRSGEESIKALADLLKSFEKIDLEVMAYCDEFGSTGYNDLLAKKRIKMVIDHLERLGISSDRIHPTVIGNRKLYNKCSHPQQCSVEQHQQNRRVEFILIRK